MRRVRVRWILLVVGVVAVLAGAWAGWQAWKVNADLTEAVDAVTELRAATSAGDTAAMDLAIDRLAESGTAADERTSGLTWSLLTRLPVLGDDARGIRVVSSVVRDLAESGARPLVEVSGELSRLTPRDAEVSIDALVALQVPVAEASAALASADAELAAEDPGDFVARLRTRYRDLAATVRDAHRALDAADTALQVMPAMLGGDGKRSYLLVFQNNAEIRATGGLPGAISVVEADRGRIAMTRQVAATEFGRAPRSVLPLEEAEKELYVGDLMGRFISNATFTPDFPRVAALVRAHWERRYSDQVDGVLAVDPVVLSYVLAVTGPVEAGGVTLTSENLVDELLHNVYLRLDDPVAQDEFFRDVARAAFEKIAAGGDRPQALLEALARGADEGRVYVHSFESEEQGALSGGRVAGELAMEASDRPQVNVTFNDATASKMSYFLDYEVDVRARSCHDGVQSYTGTARLESTAPADASSLPPSVTGGLIAEPGLQYVKIVVFAPVGGDISDLRLNGREVESARVMQGSRPADSFAVQLEPGQVLQLEWRMVSGPDQEGATDVRVTPGIQPESYSSVEGSACS